MRLGCEIIAIMPQDAQRLPARWQSVSDGDPGIFEFATQPFVLGSVGAFLAEAFGVVVESAVPAGGVEELVDGIRVAFELGQDSEVLQCQLAGQRLNAGPGLARQCGGR